MSTSQEERRFYVTYFLVPFRAMFYTLLFLINCSENVNDWFIH